MQLHRVVSFLDERDASAHYARPCVIRTVAIVLDEIAIIGVDVVVVVVIDLSVAVPVDTYLALEVALSDVVAIGSVEHHVLQLLLPFHAVVGEDEWGLELLAWTADQASNSIE